MAALLIGALLIALTRASPPSSALAPAATGALTPSGAATGASAPAPGGLAPASTVAAATTASPGPATAATGSTGSTAAKPAQVVRSPDRPLAGRTVAVDPGHNGRNGSAPSETNRLVDAGGFKKACNSTGSATGAGVSESSVNWSIALAVRTRLEAQGAVVVLTRPDDRGVGPCIDERAAIADRAHADVLLSIHTDGAAAGSYGFHVIRPGLVPGYTEDIAGPSATLATALRDALVGAGLHPSTYAGRDGLITRTDLGTLNRSDVPACIVELGNLRNPGDAATFTSPAGQARAADALVAGVAAWLARPPGERTGPAPSAASATAATSGTD